MPFLLFDFRYLLFILPALLLALFAQWRRSSTYRQSARVGNPRGLARPDIARRLLRRGGIAPVSVRMIPGDLTDHYDPRGKVMRLSEGSARYASVAAMAVVAHELGHAQQDREGYFWLQLRSGIVGLANVGSQLGIVLIFIGLLLASMSARSGGSLGLSLAWGGVVLMSAAVIFTIVTLPVELNASARAREMLARNGLVTAQEAEGVSSMLSAAALTYVAAAAQAVLQLLYFVTLLSGRDRR